MPRNSSLREFAQQTVPLLGPFGTRYKNPLTAFLSQANEPEQIRTVVERGLTPELLTTQLKEILVNDEFLRKCCGDTEKLALALDILFFGPLPNGIYEPSLGFGFAGNSIEQALVDLEEQIYEEGVFHKSAYFHLFNFGFLTESETTMQAPYPGWRVEDVSWENLKQLLGPGSFSIFLQRAASGKAFLIVEDTEGFDSEGLSEWLNRRWFDAALFLRALQLSKDAVVDIDYVVPHFTPAWVNLVQGGRTFYLGSPRKDDVASNLQYLVFPGDPESIQTIWNISQQYSSQLADRSSTLRNAIVIAIAFIEEFHKKSNRIEQFTNLMISLEALYTPTDKSELTFRVSQTCASLTSQAYNNPYELFKFLKTMFDRRGGLFHGQYDPRATAPEDFVTDSEIGKLMSVVRKSIVSFLCIYLRGEKNLRQLRKELEMSIFDEGVRQQLQDRANLDNLPLTEP